MAPFPVSLRSKPAKQGGPSASALPGEPSQLPVRDHAASPPSLSLQSNWCLCCLPVPLAVWPDSYEKEEEEVEAERGRVLLLAHLPLPLSHANKACRELIKVQFPSLKIPLKVQQKKLKYFFFIHKQ